MRLFFASFLLAATSSAILPPAWEGVREIKAVLDNDALHHYLDSGDIIRSIEKTKFGWEIHTNHSIIEIQVKKAAQAHIGPEQFELHFERRAL